MANLITKHDPYHVHKILGLASLMNYIFRIYYLFLHGTAFPRHEPILQAISCVLIHGILSLSSLLLPLPSNRNFSSPMIWSEFRLHSIIFAMRHVIATIFTLFNVWPDHNFADASMKLGLIILTIKCASLVTEKFGNREKRTTNSMPYPKWITEDMQIGVKDMYTRAQFGATKAIVLGDPTLSYFPLFGIQMAPLLMTLVRKGKIRSITYHRVYSLSLAISWVALFVRLCVQPDKLMIVSLMVSSLFPLTSLRKNKISREGVWVFYVTFHYTLAPMIKEYFGMSSIVLACATTVLISGSNTSGGSLERRCLWVAFVMLTLSIKRNYFTPDIIYEETHFDPYILKLSPLMVLSQILKQFREYGPLFNS